MFQPCANITCKRASCALCHCCQQNVCISHLNEHNESLNSQINPLADSINALNHRFKTLYIHETIRDYQQKLEQWRLDCYQKIDHLFEEKCQELNQLVSNILDEQRNKLTYIQSEISKLIQNKEITQKNIESFTSSISQLNNELEKIECTTYIQLNISPLIINDTLIYIKKLKKKTIDLSILSSVYKEIKYTPGSYCPLACNDQLLLIHQAPNLCFMNNEMIIVKEILWTYNAIRDICWSSILNKFIIIEENNIFLINENTMSIENIKTIEKRRWFACTCSDTYLFLTTGVRGSSIVEFHLSPLITAIKEWKSPNTCTKNEFINGIIYKNNILALIIKNKIEKTLRLELRSCEKLNYIWSLPLNIICNQNIAFRFCSISYDEWLIADYETGHLLEITNDGKLKTKISYKTIPYYICLFSSDILVVSTAKGVNFHKI
ncbi:unnamed protein product [Rotaria sp. Silwood1]|nr:unnamed protein product [Rotaria sp. Silwood1]CAF3560474.1 unnamed protein product [Rotaria sp. Silwood1]CAF4741580.1 unnamed protein product [Rotaria sp. Silwood1]CAF4831822.1 unnamed protein product [Rotaria sp. Silwood1]